MSTNEPRDQSGDQRSAGRSRSRGFQTVALEEAAEIVRKAGRYGYSHPEEAFASYMGHQTTNSGAFKQRFAAMRSWGLVSLEARQVQLTDLARRITHPISPDDARLALREAFMHASVFADLYEASAKGLELDTGILANRAVHALGISPKSTAKFSEVFVASAITAGLATEPTPGKVELIPTEEDAPVETEIPAEDKGSRPPVPPAPSASPVISESWPVSGGEITFEISLDHPLQAEAFAKLAEIFRAVEALVGELHTTDD